MKSWYAYLDGNPLDSKNYYLATEPPPFKGVGTKICTVYVKNSGTNPEQFSAKIRTQITNALITEEPQYTDNNELIVVLKN